MRTAFKVTVELVIEAVTHDEVADAVSSLLGEQSQVTMPGISSSLVDWQYQPDAAGNYFNPISMQISDKEDIVEGEVFGTPIDG